MWKAELNLLQKDKGLANIITLKKCEREVKYENKN